MALRITIQIAGEKQLDRALSRFGENVSDLSPAWEGVIKILQEHATRQFASEGSAGANGGWVELSPAYARQKARRWPGRPILEASSAMKQSLVGNNSDSVIISEPLAFGYGTARAYASYHQSGTRRMPRRRIIDLTEKDKRDITREIQRYLIGAAKYERWNVTGDNAGI